MNASLTPLLAIEIRSATPANRASIVQLLHAVGWEERYIEGQLDSLASARTDPGRHHVFLAWSASVPLGFVSVQFHSWNRLGQLHGLVVSPAYQRRGIASRLTRQAEHVIQEKGGRGIFVDTPATNVAARAFYRAHGYAEDYIMTDYYDEGLDGITYVKFFRRGEGSR